MKFTKKDKRLIEEYFLALRQWKRGTTSYALPVDEWTTGNYPRYKRAKALPPFTHKIDRAVITKKNKNGETIPARNLTPAERDAFEFFRGNPKRQTCYAMDVHALMDFLFDCANGKEY